MLDQTTMSHHFGELLLANSIVQTDYEPANRATEEYVQGLMDILGLTKNTGRANQKVIRCVSDFLIASRYSGNGLIAWPSANDNFVECAYSGEIARNVRRSLEGAGFLELVQKSSKFDQLASLYRATEGVAPDWLRFTKHGVGPMVEVRSEKRTVNGNKVGGHRVSLKPFEPKIGKFRGEIKSINVLNSRFPMVRNDGREVGPVRRIFNNRSLTSGGRLYGNWQHMKDTKRLEMTIGGEAICEVDLKASYPNIVHGMFGGKWHLGPDPYQLIKFVQEVTCDNRRKEMRELAKLLVASFVSTGGQTTRFPKGKKKGEDDKVISVRERFGIHKNISCFELIEQILVAFPAMRKLKGSGKCAMFAESEIFLGAIIALVAQGVPVYPMHDALIVRQCDKLLAVKALQISLKSKLGFVPDLDISQLDECPSSGFLAPKAA